MCGISGIINSVQDGFNAKDIKAMTDVVRHRGPDDAGYILFGNDGSKYLAGDTDTPEEVYKSDTPYKPAADITSFEQNNFTIANFTIPTFYLNR